MARPIKTTQVNAGTRIYYLDTCEDRNGGIYTILSEIPTDTNLKKKRHRIYIHDEHIDEVIAQLIEHRAYAKVRNVNKR